VWRAARVIRSKTRCAAERRSLAAPLDLDARLEVLVGSGRGLAIGWSWYLVSA
jgi:hypothetical protein